MSSVLSTDTVRLEEQYSAVEQKILKNLDSMTIRIFSAMWKLGPRNLLEVARQTRIPFTSIYHKVERIESRSGELAYLEPKISKLGLVKVVVLASARLGFEEAVTQALKVPNLWTAINYCEGTFTHDSVHAVPFRYLNEFRKYISQLRELDLIKRFRIIMTGDYTPNFPDFNYYDPAAHEWRFTWNRWFNELVGAKASTHLDDPHSYDVLVDKKDLLIIKELQINGRKSFAELAPIAGISLYGVKYHFDKKLVPAGIVQNYQFNIVPYPKELSAIHEIMIEFNGELPMDKFYSIIPKLFFVIGTSKILGQPSILLRTYILESQLPKLFVFFSQLAKAGLVHSYSAVRKDLQSRISQTIPYELFDDNKGWSCDFERYSKELTKLIEAWS